MAKNKRLSLRQISSFELKPLARLQMILGSNGSGKSTVLDALSLQPALPAHYHRGGKQEHTVERNGSEYELCYDFSGVKNHYSISKDGEVIYSGHVSSACTQYVAEHLGITREVHEICSGRKKFTRMSTAERRAWFTKLSPTDYSYALSYYKRLGDSHRDLEGSVKRLSERLLQEKDRAIDDIKAQQIREAIVKLKSDKDELLKQWTPVGMTFEESMQKLESINVAIGQAHINFFLSLKIFTNMGDFQSLDDVRKQEAAQRGRLSFVQHASDELYNKVEANRGEIAKSQYLASQDIQEVIGKIAAAKNQIRTLRERIKYDGYNEPQNALSALVSIWQELHKTISQFAPDPHNEVTTPAYEEKMALFNDYTLRLKALEAQVEKYDDVIHRFEHRDSSSTINCPKCSHSFDPTADEGAYGRAKIEKSNASVRISDIIEKQEALNKVLGQMREQLELYRYFFILGKANRETLEPVWSVLLEDNIVKKNPGKAIMMLEMIRTDLQDLVEVQKLEATVHELEAIRELSEKNAGVNLNELQVKNAAMERELYDYQMESQVLQKRIERLGVIQRQWISQDEAAEQLERLTTSRDHFILQAEDANRKSVINSVLAYLDQEILLQEKAISQIESQKAVIASLERDIEDYRSRAKLLKKALDALSPSKGLIAKGLTGFINHFVEQMNAVIAKVWLYPLRISAVEIKEETGGVDLDYSFTYTYDDNQGADDIREASGAQKEIFDLAFMLVSMKHLGMDEYPIFLDEFSVNMDYAHRKEAMKMVVDLLNNSNFSQIFMVSHYEGSYGSLSNADITVLCPENIEMPMGLSFNERATIEHA